jgi:hypothetical protein
VTDLWWNDDEQLLAALDEAIRTVRDVPDRFVQSARATYAWHGIDAELATLTRDSTVSDLVGGSVFRAEPAALRALTFSAPQLTIEVEITGQALVGQVVPEQHVELEIRIEGEPPQPIPVDEVGSFVIRPAPSSAFRLYFRTADSRGILTDLITL